MSEPPNKSITTTLSDPHKHHHHRQPQHLALLPTTAAGTAGTAGTTATTTSSIIREYRKGNWTLQETLTLITAKKLDDERRIKASSTPPDQTTTTTKHSQCGSKTGELRWKWVENYCWNHGCLRSQNQCNDKWDNLLRDYKKVREYESRSNGSQDLRSYWNMERHERKDRNLPSNLASDVFQALNEVVHKRYPPRTTTAAATTTQPSSSAAGLSPAQVSVRPPPPPPAAPAVSETENSSDTDQSEKFDTDTKRRKVRNIGSSIVRSASVLARTLRSCEEKKEKRHREVMELEERRLQIEETRNEVSRQGITDLVTAVTNLSGAIQSLVSDHHNHT